MGWNCVRRREELKVTIQALTFHLLVECALEEDGEPKHPLLLAYKPITVLVKGSKDTVHEVVITHREVVMKNVPKLDTV